MSKSSTLLFDKIRAAVPQVVSSSGGTAETFHINQLAEGVEFTDAIRAQIDAIIAAHRWSEKANDEKLTDKAIALIADLEAEVSVKATWDARSNAYRQEVIRRGLLGIAKLARLVVQQFDSE